jgi:hypothetical protein
MSISGRQISGASSSPGIIYNAPTDSGIVPGDVDKVVYFDPLSQIFKLTVDNTNTYIGSQLVGFIDTYLSSGTAHIRRGGSMTLSGASIGKSYYLQSDGSIASVSAGNVAVGEPGINIRMGFSTANNTINVNPTVIAKAPDVSGKADKITEGTENNIVSQDASGNIKDAGISVSGLANTTHQHSATEITSGSIPDARIPSSNVTQHANAIDHNVLANYDVKEHRKIDDSSNTSTNLWSASKIKSQIDNATTGVASGILDPVDDLTALGNVVVTSNEDKYIINVDGQGLYRYDFGSTSLVDSPKIIAPLSEVGRFIRMNSPLDDHNLLSGKQGGGTVSGDEEFYHLTSDQHATATTPASTGADGYLASGDFSNIPSSDEKAGISGATGADPVALQSDLHAQNTDTELDDGNSGTISGAELKTHIGNTDIHSEIDDSAASGSKVYSSTKVEGLISNVHTAGTDTGLDTGGTNSVTAAAIVTHHGDSTKHRLIDDNNDGDAGTADSDISLWSANKIVSAIQSSGNLPTLTQSSIGKIIGVVDVDDNPVYQLIDAPTSTPSASTGTLDEVYGSVTLLNVELPVNNDKLFTIVNNVDNANENGMYQSQQVTVGNWEWVKVMDTSPVNSFMHRFMKSSRTR